MTALWRALARGLRALVRRDAADRDVDDEVRQYVEDATADAVASGLPPDQARRRALAAIGSAAAVREHVRSSGWEHLVVTTAADLRYGVRGLKRAPAFTITATIALALGIGAATAIFSAVHPILLHPLPYPDARSIVSIRDYGENGKPLDVTFGTYSELRRRLRSCEALAVMRAWQPTLANGDAPERLDGQRVSFDYFRVLGVPPRIGRGFTAADDRPGAPNVAIVADALWRRRLNADPSIVGREMNLDGIAYTVVGIMPAGFENVTAPAAAIWTTLQYDPALPADGREWGHHLRLIARLYPDASAQALRREIDDIGRHAIAAFSRPAWASLRNGLSVVPLQDEVTAGTRPALLALSGAVLLLLAMACASVTNLLLVRGAGRRGELAVRAALGAGRLRIARQLVTEALLLALLGAAGGVLVANGSISMLLAASPVALPRAGAIEIDPVVFLFAVGLAAGLGLSIGLFTTLRTLREAPNEGLAHASLRSTPAHLRARKALAAAQMAMAVVLLVCAGLLFRSVRRLFAVPPGFDASHVLVMQVQTWGPRYATPRARDVFFTAVRETVSRVRGVESVSLTNQLPLSGDAEEYGVQLTGDGIVKKRAGGSAYRYVVLPGYFDAMRIPVRGRAFTAADTAAAARVAVVSEALARERFGSGDPIGHDVIVGDVPATIVGVAGDVRQVSLAAGGLDAVYVPGSQVTYPERAMWIVVRGHGDVARLAAPIRSALWSIDRAQPIARTDLLDDVVARSAGERRFALLVFETFSIVAILLAAVGIYGVLAAGVAERTREIGLRAALGASTADVLRLVVRDATAMTGAGLVAGGIGAWASSRAVAALLFGTSPLDPGTYAAAGGLLVIVAGLATVVPARRAALVDPAVTLRME